MACHVSARCYKDPWQVKWEPQHQRTAGHVATASARAALNRSNLHSAGNSRIWRDITPSDVSAAQAKQLLETWDEQEKYDKMTEAFGNFMIHVVPVSKITSSKLLISTGNNQVLIFAAEDLLRADGLVSAAPQNANLGQLAGVQ